MRNSTLLVAIAMLIISQSSCFAFDKNKENEKLFWGKQPPVFIEEPQTVPKGGLITPPGEHSHFPVRKDGQDYVLDIDMNVNLTRALNRFYYDPKWRGEEWVPFDQISIIEKAARNMGTWKEYNEFTTLRVFNGFHIFFEKYSGYGP